MAHELSVVDGNAEMMSANGLDCWHGLGNVIAGKVGREEVLTAAHLNWSVSKRPMYRVGRDGTMIEIETARVMVRDDLDTELGNVGLDYGIVQNETLADWMNLLVDGGARYETAGALRGGRIVWFLLNLGDSTHVEVGGDPLENYVLGVTSHDRSHALTLRRTKTRVVCRNTMSWAMRGTPAAVRLHHTANVKMNMQEARKALDLSFTWHAEFDAEIERLMNTDAEFERIVDALAPEIEQGDATPRAITLRNNVREGLWTAYVSPHVDERYHGTGWGAIQAVNSYEQWLLPMRKGDKSLDGRMERQALRLIGDGFDLTSKARQLVMAGAK